jgi:hypothetical protein
MEIKFTVERRFSDSELELIRSTFNNLPLLKSIRKVMLQMPFTEAEEISYRKALTPEAMKIVRKALLPTITGDEPLSQITDAWSTVTVTDKMPDIALLILKARELTIKYLDEQLNILGGVSKVKTIIFENFTILKDKREEEAYIDIIARNNILGNIEKQLMELYILSAMPKETPEDIAKRNTIDSSK